MCKVGSLIIVCFQKELKRRVVGGDGDRVGGGVHNCSWWRKVITVLADRNVLVITERKVSPIKNDAFERVLKKYEVCVVLQLATNHSDWCHPYATFEAQHFRLR